MKSSIRVKAQGAHQDGKGKAKEVAGKACDNPKLVANGKLERITGKVQGKNGQARWFWWGDI